jgi:soluble lytic murein transglycosylase
MLNGKQLQISLALSAGVGAFLVGAVFSPTDVTDTIENLSDPLPLSKDNNSFTPEVSNTFKLARLAPENRAAQLEALAKNADSRVDSYRARYLLASDRLQKQQPEDALQWLDGLEADYPILAPHILEKRARAYQMMGNQQQAQATWQELLQEYSDSPVVANALYALGKENSQYWDRAIAEFPSHPRSVDIAYQRLQENPQQRALLLLLAEHGLYLSDIISVLDRLVNNHGEQLSPQAWEKIGFAYWEKLEYGKAGKAYQKAPPTPKNAYRAARGIQLGGDRQKAIEAYKQLVQKFPNGKTTGLALLRLGQLLPEKEALPYLQRAIQNFPEQAPEALLERAKILAVLNSPKSAQQARQSILSQYSSSETAAKMRMSRAEERGRRGDYQGATQWASELIRENPDSDIAPQAQFWIGKWSQRLGQTAQAREAFEQVIRNYPHSYYAWRAAVMLGWEVGDFNKVRYLDPKAERPQQLSVLPAGSETLKELYQLGQYREAWRRWQWEYQTPMAPSVSEQFTDGLIRLGVGDNLDGIFMVSSLDWRDKQEEIQQVQALKQQPTYWHALYPFPYIDAIVSWSEQNQLNPMLVTALIRQESRFMPSIESVAGAKGLMQVMPSTAEFITKKIPLSEYNLENPKDNIRLGTWYLDYTHQQYQDNSMLAIASYNAGPGNVERWVNRFGVTDADEFVERIPFPETRNYVEKVFENYWNYLQLYNPQVRQKVQSFVDQGRNSN